MATVSRRLTVVVLAAALIAAYFVIPWRNSSKAAASVPLRLDTGDAEQVVMVRSVDWYSSDAIVETLEWKNGKWENALGPFLAKIGRNGFSVTHHEGDGTTPAGAFTLAEAFGTLPNPDVGAVRLPYRQALANDWWVSDQTSPLYNTWQHGPAGGRWDETKGELLTSDTYRAAYKYALVIDYNRAPVVPGSGSAIFLHTTNGKATSGCVAIADDQLVSILKWLNPDKKPRIVMGPDAYLIGAEMPPTPTATTSDRFASITPHRALDTRAGIGHTGALGPEATLDLTVAGADSTVPVNATAVFLNLTIVNQTEPTYLQAYPVPGGAETPPTVSNVNAAPGEERANLVVVRVGAGGKIRIGNFAGRTDIVADIVGYSGPSAVGELSTVTPYRALDTRTGAGVGGITGKVGTDSQISFSVPLAPRDTSAVLLNITATEATAATFVSAFPGGTQWPGTSTVNTLAGEDSANLTIVALQPGGTVTLRNHAGETHLVADVAGFVTSANGAMFVPAAQPLRILDSRIGLNRRGSIAPGETITVELPGLPTNTTAVALTITTDAPTTDTHITAFPSGEAEPITSNVNAAKNATRANLVVVKVGLDGKISLRNNAGTTQLVADISGWFVGGS